MARSGSKTQLENVLGQVINAATEETLQKNVAINVSVNNNNTIVTAGSIKTITETDGTRTRTTVIDSTNPLNKTITSTWS